MSSAQDEINSEAFLVGDKVIFDVWRSWKQTDTRTGIVFSVVSPILLIVETDDNHKRFVVATDSIISHTPKEV